MYFEYGEKEIEYLKTKDKRLGEAIDKIGHIYREIEPDLFTSVVHQIVGQQISTVAAKTVWTRLCDKLGTIDADTIHKCSREELQSCGISFRKVDYIKDFSDKIYHHNFDIYALHSMTDEEVVCQLSSLKGIGVWTAEMLLLFCLQRPNVMSYGDLAICRGLRMLYHHRKVDKAKFAKYARRYSPYGSVASLYLWAISGGAIPGMKDFAPPT